MLSRWELALAVDQSSIKSATHINRAVVSFLGKIEQVNKLVETRITVGGQLVQVTLLTQPAARITLSNGMPFISNEFLIWELSRHGKVVSLVRKMLSGSKSIVWVDDFDYALKYYVQQGRTSGQDVSKSRCPGPAWREAPLSRTEQQRGEWRDRDWQRRGESGFHGGVRFK